MGVYIMVVIFILCYIYCYPFGTWHWRMHRSVLSPMIPVRWRPNANWNTIVRQVRESVVTNSFSKERGALLCSFVALSAPSLHYSFSGSSCSSLWIQKLLMCRSVDSEHPLETTEGSVPLREDRFFSLFGYWCRWNVPRASEMWMEGKSKKNPRFS